MSFQLKISFLFVSVCFLSSYAKDNVPQQEPVDSAIFYYNKVIKPNSKSDLLQAFVYYKNKKDENLKQLDTLNAIYNLRQIALIQNKLGMLYDSETSAIEALNQEFPELKIIVYSIEDRIQRVRRLINEHGVKGYVCKGRRGLIELSEAVNAVFDNNLYLSDQVNQALHKKSNLEIDDFDVLLLKHLSNGLSQDQISLLFKEQNISPNSLSTIEKRLNKLRIQFKANNAIHLVAIVKDLGLI
ncbi:response regulator transcription factor [Formosa maritima]|uniref:response regulator transcription factor n=1 Tax=Formosa maritima TaxID=2592046 RepID=UPI0018F40514|nr:response regulator transcription factor [Formosa maritima]